MMSSWLRQEIDWASENVKSKEGLQAEYAVDKLVSHKDNDHKQYIARRNKYGHKNGTLELSKNILQNFFAM